MPYKICYLDQIPTCQFCEAKPAKYDVVIKHGVSQFCTGAWAYMCEDCKQVYSSPTANGSELKHISEKPEREKKQFTSEEIEEMLETDTFFAVDGCEVEMDGTCPHGFPSPVLGMI